MAFRRDSVALWAAEESLFRRSRTSAAKTGADSTLVIAALNRCAAQRQAQNRLVPNPDRSV